jgi:hypothetical protein
MKILFSGVGECKIYEVVEMQQCPPEGANINFYAEEGDSADKEWSVRTVVWLPKNREYDAYCVVGRASY